MVTQRNPLLAITIIVANYVLTNLSNAGTERKNSSVNWELITENLTDKFKAGLLANRLVATSCQQPFATSDGTKWQLLT
ncbi:hypothetical protein IQ244_20785 [Nostoc sp. LEGE 06077]|uniref:hypothetical protein n=1 Tax=Nostoc sp. LEGE 06077 TaxID=915325 RepID=UPI0018815863|nr:hypothetical protein [Nostoc sp. LEGE 06077]MBE9208930.1 hypothetical protein [Nostoc sp. LEGE 06077]